jgi:hypothetical protein
MTEIVIHSVSCPICLSAINSNARALTCLHTFHRECIDTWFQQQPTCPICRTRTEHIVQIASARLLARSMAEQNTSRALVDIALGFIATYMSIGCTILLFLTTNAQDSMVEHINCLGFNISILIVSIGRTWQHTWFWNKFPVLAVIIFTVLMFQVVFKVSFNTFRDTTVIGGVMAIQSILLLLVAKDYCPVFLKIYSSLVTMALVIATIVNMCDKIK